MDQYYRRSGSNYRVYKHYLFLPSSPSPNQPQGLPPGFSVGFVDILQCVVFACGVPLHAFFQQAGDGAEGDLLVEVGVHDFFVGDGEVGGHGAALAGGFVGERQAGETFHVGLEEGEFGYLQ